MECTQVRLRPGQRGLCCDLGSPAFVDQVRRKRSAARGSACSVAVVANHSCSVGGAREEGHKHSRYLRTSHGSAPSSVSRQGTVADASLTGRRLIINLAREINASELLPSAFYDLSRYLPSQLMLNHMNGTDGSGMQLSYEDFLRVLRGKEQAARFFSTFIVNELEGRDPSDACARKRNPATLRACQVAFEAINFELLRDVNGMVCNRNSDPLFAIAESLSIQTREDVPGVENRAVYRACEACRLEYGAVVEALREDFWRRIPDWFELEVDRWG